MSAQVWKRLKQQVSEIKTSYSEIRLPHRRGESLVINRGLKYVFFAPDGQEHVVTFTPEGATYLLYRLHAYQKDSFIDREKARELLKENKRTSFCTLVNIATHQMLTTNYKEAARQSWIMATNKDNHMVGMMVAYNPFSHQQVMDMIESAGLQGQVKWGSVSDIKLRLFIETESLGDSPAEFGMMIFNGETGHVALSYHAAIKVASYVYSWPLSTTRRHLSNIDEAKDNLGLALKECRNIAIINIIKNTKVKELALHTKNEKLQQLIESKMDQPIAELIAFLARYRDERGLKTEAEKLLDQVFKSVKGELN